MIPSREIGHCNEINWCSHLFSSFLSHKIDTISTHMYADTNKIIAILYTSFNLA
uniref:Uncharacterized protein n=1 Tax=Siphoviridae sp. ctuBK6 TaxID=2827963 RepID=A0A8S5THQ9_9CAUD|nr:MAG TPA: hypothetical protein [Siphoviridae sp. ctuBK6]